MGSHSPPKVQSRERIQITEGFPGHITWLLLHRVLMKSGKSHPGPQQPKPYKYKITIIPIVPVLAAQQHGTSNTIVHTTMRRANAAAANAPYANAA